ncbi:hypothetical protein [Actinokineospora iranica]|uniref:PH domain-containing protein n=1 Tax=Actinokineospora iranica TaxID=1271860 RepID=A0A1G6WKC3_9PSEU|nr:hypothetical protein [Actinokineospora iranica]SDD65526.1 hypothetical protein SAMN05216174_11519 [Actinokineospora iranica]
METPRSVRRVWRVRWWVRLIAVAVPLLTLPSVLRPLLLDGDGSDGVPLSEQVLSVALYAVLVLLAWAAFRSRVELADGQVAVVNPWGTRRFPAAEVAEVLPGVYGLEFHFTEARPVVGFAVHTPRFQLGQEPRWVDIARSVTGREPA